MSLKRCKKGLRKSKHGFSAGKTFDFYIPNHTHTHLTFKGSSQVGNKPFKVSKKEQTCSVQTTNTENTPCMCPAFMQFAAARSGGPACHLSLVCVSRSLRFISSEETRHAAHRIRKKRVAPSSSYLTSVCKSKVHQPAVVGVFLWHPSPRFPPRIIILFVFLSSTSAAFLPPTITLLFLSSSWRGVSRLRSDVRGNIRWRWGGVSFTKSEACKHGRSDGALNLCVCFSAEPFTIFLSLTLLNRDLLWVSLHRGMKTPKQQQ